MLKRWGNVHAGQVVGSTHPQGERNLLVLSTEPASRKGMMLMHFLCLTGPLEGSDWWFAAHKQDTTEVIL